MMKPYTAFAVGLLLTLVVSQAVAQPVQLRTPHAETSDGPQPISITDELLRQSFVQDALTRYRAQGPRTASLRARPDPQVGDLRTFKVRDIAAEDSARDANDGRLPNPIFRTIDATLQAKAERFLLWVETAELQPERVRTQDVAALGQALGEMTPAGSIDPNQGIIPNDEQIFGQPPNIDGDNMTDVLLTDVRDLYEPVENPGFVAGFFDPLDIVSDQANSRDVLYLDTRPGIYEGAGDSLQYRLSERLTATAAHEYQHLIHIAFDGDELAFVNEGLSEYAEVLNGYPLRPPAYLGDPEQYNVSLLRWTRDDPVVQLNDYQRAALLTTYLADRIGPEATGRLTQHTEQGLAGYRRVLEGTSITLESLLLDFHTANFINDRNVEPHFGYARYENTFRAVPSLRFDGRISMETEPQPAAIKPGGVQYLAWETVENLSLTLDADLAGMRDRLRARALLYRDGAVQVEPLSLPVSRTFSGRYDRIVVVAAHVAPNQSQVTLQFNAHWQVDRLFEVRTVAYDEGQVARKNGDLVFVLLGENELLTRFENPDPDSAFLSGVSLPLYYLNQFGNEEAPPEDALRDFTLIIRGVDDNGAPGGLLFSRSLDDPRAYSPLYANTAPTLQFASINLADYQAELSGLPNQFYLGFADVGTDENVIVYAPAPYDTRNLSYVGPNSSGRFIPLWDLELQSGTSLEDTIIPIRAEFLVPVAPPALPERMTLAQNYPNPFDPSQCPTTIAYELPEAAHVRLTVYDLLGRRVAVLVDGMQPATPPLVVFDASGLAAGVYLYTLEAAGQIVTRTMMLYPNAGFCDDAAG